MGVSDSSGLDFFLYDLSWRSFCNGEIELEQIYTETGIKVVDLKTLRQGIEAIFEKHAPTAIAVKAQHAYNRTLNWIERNDVEASATQTMQIATRIMRDNQYACFNIEGTRANIRAAA